MPQEPVLTLSEEYRRYWLAGCPTLLDHADADVVRMRRLSFVEGMQWVKNLDGQLEGEHRLCRTAYSIPIAEGPALIDALREDKFYYEQLYAGYEYVPLPAGTLFHPFSGRYSLSVVEERVRDFRPPEIYTATFIGRISRGWCIPRSETHRATMLLDYGDAIDGLQSALRQEPRAGRTHKFPQCAAA